MEQNMKCIEDLFNKQEWERLCEEIISLSRLLVEDTPDNFILEVDCHKNSLVSIILNVLLEGSNNSLLVESGLKILMNISSNDELIINSVFSYDQIRQLLTVVCHFPSLSEVYQIL